MSIMFYAWVLAAVLAAVRNQEKHGTETDSQSEKHKNSSYFFKYSRQKKSSQKQFHWKKKERMNKDIVPISSYSMPPIKGTLKQEQQTQNTENDYSLKEWQGLL